MSPFLSSKEALDFDLMQTHSQRDALNLERNKKSLEEEAELDQLIHKKNKHLVEL